MFHVHCTMEILDTGAAYNTSLVQKRTFSPSNKQNTTLQNRNASEATAFFIRWTNLIKKAVAFETSRVYSMVFVYQTTVIYLHFYIWRFIATLDIYKFQIKLVASLHSRSIRVALSLYAVSVFFCHAFHLRTDHLSLLFVTMKIINTFRGSRGGSLVTNIQTTRIKDSQVNKCDLLY
jgi:hypothetical protein